MSQRVYYIAEVSGLYNNTSSFKIEPFTGFLVDSEGYNTVSTYRSSSGERMGAKKFDKPVSFKLKDISNPWYYKVENLRWIKVTENFDKQEEYI